MALIQETNFQKLNASCMPNQVLSSLLQKEEKEENDEYKLQNQGREKPHVKAKGHTSR